MFFEDDIDLTNEHDNFIGDAMNKVREVLSEKEKLAFANAIAEAAGAAEIGLISPEEFVEQIAWMFGVKK